jgi:hypothetical protein
MADFHARVSVAPSNNALASAGVSSIVNRELAWRIRISPDTAATSSSSSPLKPARFNSCLLNVVPKELPMRRNFNGYPDTQYLLSLNR